MPKGLELWKPAYGIVNFQGKPMYRCLAWALHDYVLHGGHLTVNSADRRDSVVRRFNKRYHTDVHSQKFLFEHQDEPGFFPANPPGTSSHERRADGNVFYGKRGSLIPRYKLGIDAVQRPGGDAHDVVAWLNRRGYKATRPYFSSAERHHFSFAKSPTSNARRRLRAWKKGA